MNTYDPAFAKLHTMHRMWKDSRRSSSTNGEAVNAEAALRRQLEKHNMTMESFENLVRQAEAPRRPFQPAYNPADPSSGFTRRQSPPPPRQSAPPPIDKVDVRFTCRTKFEQDIAAKIVAKYGGNPRAFATRVASTIISFKVDRMKVPVVTAKWKEAKRKWATDLERFFATFAANL